MRPEVERQASPARGAVRLLYAGGVVRIGTFRCGAADPGFHDSGPIRDFNVVFPRGAWFIQHEGQPAFLASPLLSPVYNDGQRYVRRPLGAPAGASSDWVALTARSEVVDLVSAYDPGAVDRPDRPLPFRCAPATRRTYWRQRWLIVRLRDAPPLDPLEVEEEALRIFAGVVRSGFDEAPGEAATASDRAIVEAARTEITARFRRPLRLIDLAAELGISASRLCRAFRHHGLSVHRMILDLRLRTALEAVLDGEADLTALALDLGFSSHSHFTAAFRSAFRMPPSRARALRRQGWRALLGEGRARSPTDPPSPPRF